MNPSRIDLILTNRNRRFQNSTAVEKDHRKLTVTVLKTFFTQKKAKSIIYGDYKLFSNETFSQEYFMLIKAHREMNYLTISQINDIFISSALTCSNKTKLVRENEGLFMTKKVRKEITIRFRLKNNYHKNNTEIFKLIKSKEIQIHYSDISVENMFIEILKSDLAKAAPKDSIPRKITKKKPGPP